MEFDCLYNDKPFRQQLAEGHPAAFDLLIAHYQSVCYSVAFKWMKNEETARDIVQTVFMKVWLARKVLTRVRDLDAYIHSILRRECYIALAQSNEVKKLQQKYREYTLKDLQQVAGGEDTFFHLLEEAIETLPPQRRLAFFLYFIKGLNRKEVAEKMHLSLETVKTHLKKGKEEVLAFCRQKLPPSLLLLLADRFL